MYTTPCQKLVLSWEQVVTVRFLNLVNDTKQSKETVTIIHVRYLHSNIQNVLCITILVNNTCYNIEEQEVQYWIGYMSIYKFIN